MNLKIGKLIYALPLLAVFTVMVLINESSRTSTVKSGDGDSGFYMMNPHSPSPLFCTWHCHNATIYCKQNHVKLLQNHFAYSDPFYFGLITMLMKSGNYGAANVIFLVFLWPFFMSFLLVKSVLIQLQIKKLKS
jgi:hypothetical protein